MVARKYILFLCVFILFVAATRGSSVSEAFETADPKRFILLLRGEAFRKGGQHSRTIGAEDIYDEQQAACSTHMDLIRSIEAKGFQVEVYIDTYSTQYDNRLRENYGGYVKGARFHTTRFASQSLLIKDGIELIGSAPAPLLILRLDMYLKPPFIETYRPETQTIQFFSVCSHGWHKTPKGNPRINDVLFHFPEAAFERTSMLFENNFIGWHELLDYEPLEYGSMYSFMTTKYYDSDSEKDFNPYYRLVGRPESSIWRSEGKEFPRDE
jgi:hypothetical protein